MSEMRKYFARKLA